MSVRLDHAVQDVKAEGLNYNELGNYELLGSIDELWLSKNFHIVGNHLMNFRR